MARERVVVVGAGNISRVWLEALAAEKVTTAAVVDLDVARAKTRIEDYKLSAEASSDMKAMIRKYHPDFVIDLTVPEAHCAVACTAMQMGCHVVSEKPMAPTMAQARKMVKTSEKTGRLYMVSQSRRYFSNHEMTQRVVASGRVGALTTLNCDFYRGGHMGGFREQMASPLILDMAIHHFDMARYLSGADPVAVYAREFNPSGSWFKGDAAASCIFEMTGGIIFTYRGSWTSMGYITSWNGSWRIHGEIGGILMENDEAPRTQVLAGKTGFIWPMKDVKAPARKLKHETFRGALRDMLAFIRTGRKPVTECHDNIKSLAMVHAAIESSRKGRRVPVVTGLE